MTQPIRAVIYARVSKPGEKSVRDQENVGRRDLASIGAEVVSVYTDKLSASRYRRVESRPGFVATQELIRTHGADLLWTFAANRAHRDLDDYVPLRRLCIDTNTRWRYGGRTYDLSKASDRRTANADAIRAEEFGDDLSEAILRGMQEAREDGRAHGKIPRGYRIVRDETSGEPLRREAIPAQAAVIREAARRVLARESLGSVVRELEGRWRDAGGGGVWAMVTVRRMLVNPTYAGLRTHRGKVEREGKWEPILSVEEHEQLRALLTDPSRRASDRGPGTRYLLSYIAECGVCGSVVRPKAARPSRPSSVATYRCKDGHIGRSMAVVDEFVEELLVSEFEDPAVAARLRAPDVSGGPSLEDGLAEIARLEDQLLRWVRDAARSGLSALSVKAYEAEMNSQIAEVRERLQAHSPDPLLERLAGADARNQWADLDLLQRRNVVRSCMKVAILPLRDALDPIGVEAYPIGALANPSGIS